ncbi:MAG: TonB-dependent receptor [Rhodospirillaceae bacterium]|nr:TonB-dependent receptor [Rhodospirillaceae bacterium]
MTHAALRGFAAACLATTCLVGIAAEAQAQIEEIVVTTRKRAENLQEVPIVVTAFTSETLERKGLADLKDVIKYTAGVQLDEGFSAQDTRVVIRGLSPTRGRPNVAFLMDDVDISSEAIQTGGSSLLINPRLFDLERVEIVKGPHSALYGRSAFAGAINYITKKPGDEFEGSVSLDAATYGDFEAKAGISGPVVPGVLSMGLNIAGWSSDGFYNNSVTRADVGGGEGAGTAVSAVFTPSDDFKATFRAEYSSDHFDPQARTHIGATLAPIPTAALVLANPRLNGQYLTVTGSAGTVSSRALVPTLSTDPRTGEDYTGNQRQIFRTTMRFDYETSFATLSSISHYGTGRVHQFEDAQRQGDFNNLTIAAETNFNTHTRLMSEELRATSNQEGPLNWVVGGLWWNEEVWQDSRSFTCFVPTGSTCGPLVRQVGTSRPSAAEIYGRDTLHYSAYALAEYNITEQLGISVEVRHSWEKEGLLAPGTVSKGIGCASPFRALQADNVTLRCSGVTATQNLPFTNPTFNNTVAAGINPVTKSDFWAPRFGLDYKATDDILLYASASKGIKPGGVSTVSGGASGIDAASQAYEPEKLWVYEVGTKTSWLDNTLQLNASGYYQDFSGKQVSTQILLSTGSTGSRILNASSARVWGLDLEGGVAINENLSFSAAYTWLDAKYNDFVIANNSLGTISNAGNCTASTLAGAFTCLVDRTGNKLEDTPTHSLQFSPNWTAPLSGDVSYFIEATVQYTSKRFDTEDNKFFFPSYWNTDLRIGFNNEAAGWEVVGYVNNLFDDDTIKTGFASPDFLRSYCLGGPPCNIPGVGAGTFNFVLPSHFTASLPDKRQFGIRAKYSF